MNTETNSMLRIVSVLGLQLRRWILMIGVSSNNAVFCFCGNISWKSKCM